MVNDVFITQGILRKQTVLMVNERGSYIVVAQLSPEFTAKLVDEWKAKGLGVRLDNLKRAIERASQSQ